MSCHTMTNEQIRGMVNFNKNRSDKNKELVFDAVRVLGSSLPHIITKYIEKEAFNAASIKFNMKVEKKEIKNYVKKNSIHIRTVRRKLPVLIKEGRVVKKENGEYAISDL